MWCLYVQFTLFFFYNKKNETEIKNIMEAKHVLFKFLSP